MDFRSNPLVDHLLSALARAGRLRVLAPSVALLAAACSSGGGGGGLTPPGASTSTVEITPSGSIVADGVSSVRIAVTVRSESGTPLADRPVLVRVSGGGNELEQNVDSTLIDGRVVATLTSTKAEVKEVTVTVGEGSDAVVLADKPHITFIGDAKNLSATLSGIAISPDVLPADGQTTAKIKVVVRDANGNRVPDQTVEVFVTGSENTLVQPPEPTDAKGIATATLVSTAPEVKTVSATVHAASGDLDLADHPFVEFQGDSGEISALHSTVTASPDTDLLADGDTYSTITIVVRDGEANPVPDQEVKITMSGTGNVIDQPPGLTDQNGTAVGRVASHVAETKTIVVKVNPGPDEVEILQQPTIEFVSPVSASTSEILAEPAFGTLADGSAEIELTAIVRDEQGNPVKDRTVIFEVSGLGNSIDQPPPTDSNGTAVGKLASTVAETKTVRAIVDPGQGQVVLDDTIDVVFVWATPGHRYVRVSGNDGDDGETPATAWRTIGKAASSLSPGEIAHVGAGVYQESVRVANGGDPGDPIAFVADVTGQWTGDAGEAVIDGGGDSAAFEIDGADHVIVDGFTIRNAEAGDGAGIRVGADATEGVVLRKNRIHENGIGVRASNAIDLAIEENRISRQRAAGSSGGHGIEVQDCTDTRIVGNLVYANEGNGVLVTGGSLDVVIEACTLYANEQDQILVDSLLNVAEAENNIVSAGLADGLEVEVGSVLTSDYNLLWLNQGLDWNGLLMGPNDRVADPLLLDPPGPDHLLGGENGYDDRFELAPASPAENTGSTDAAEVELAGGGTLGERTTRTDFVLDGTPPDADPLNLGYHHPEQIGPLPPLAAGDGRTFYGVAEDPQPRTRRVAGNGGWSQPARAIPIVGRPRWVRHAISPLGGDEEIALVQLDDGSELTLTAMRWERAGWHVDWTATGFALNDAHARSFDLLCTPSGDALAVYADGSASPRFRRWNQGEWSGAQDVLNNPPGNQRVLWVELYSRGGEEATLLYADAASDLHVVDWEGSSWDGSTLTTLETSLRTTQTRCFDAAFESQSGMLMAVWAGPDDTASWATRDAGSTVWNVQVGITGMGTTPAVLDLASQPTSDRIALVGLEDVSDGGEPKVATWNGIQWSHVGRLETGTGVSVGAQKGDLNVAAGWAGASAIAIYADELGGALDWGRWTTATGWTLQGDLPIGGKTTTESIIAVSRPDGASLWALVSDADGNLFAAVNDGKNWALSNGGEPLEDDISSTDGAPFDLDFD